MKTVSVVKQLIANLRSLSALLSTKSERVASMLMISYTAASSLRFSYYHMLFMHFYHLYRRDLLAEYARFPTIGLEEFQV